MLVGGRKKRKGKGSTSFISDFERIEGGGGQGWVKRWVTRIVFVGVMWGLLRVFRVVWGRFVNYMDLPPLEVGEGEEGKEGRRERRLAKVMLDFRAEGGNELESKQGKARGEEKEGKKGAMEIFNFLFIYCFFFQVI